MKKSLLALAMSIATGGAIAQSSVTLYGVIDQGYMKESDKVDIPNGSENYSIKSEGQQFDNSLSTANRFGIKTQEDLGEGLTARATIEFGFGEASQSQSAIHTLRQAWVSIGSSEGHSIKVGRIQSQSFEILAETDASGSGKVAGSILSTRDTSLDRRQGVMYHYKQPGYGLGLGYYYGDQKFQENDYGTSKKGQGVEVSAHFDDGFAFGKVVYATGTLGGKAGIHENEAKRNLFTSNIGLKLTPDTKISYTYQNHKLTTTTNVGGTVQTSSVDKIKGNAHQINLNHMLTPKIEVLSSYTSGVITDQYEIDLRSDNFGGAPLQAKAIGYQFGGRYHFSKRTNLYALYGRENWKVNAAEYDLYNIRAKRETVAVGLKHMF